MQEQDQIKGQVISQFKDPPTQNHQLLSYPRIIHDAYNSDFTANTNYSEDRFFSLTDTEFDTSTDVNSNGEIEGTTSDLTVNATTSKNII